MFKKINVPKFKNENEERNFWSKVNLSEYFEKQDFTSIAFPNLKPTSSAISVRIPNYLLVRIKEKAHELHIPYQTLMKQYIAKGILAN